MASKTHATTVSQLSCYSSIHRNLLLHRRSLLSFPTPPPLKLSFSVNLEECNTKTSTSGSRRAYIANDASRSYFEETKKSYLSVEDNVNGNLGTNGSIQENGIVHPKRAAKIHDFCLGIPFGGIVFSGGLVGLIFSRSTATLSTLLFGAALLALSTFSLKIWRSGKSCLPFILGQAVLAATLLWKNLQAYSMTKRILPNGFYLLISAAMLCFYSYVILAGGNPPPKKLKSTVNVS